MHTSRQRLHGLTFLCFTLLAGNKYYGDLKLLAQI